MVGSCCLVSICRRGGMERGHVLLLHRNLTSSKLWAEALLLGTCGGCLQKLTPGQEPYPQERHSLPGLLQKHFCSASASRVAPALIHPGELPHLRKQICIMQHLKNILLFYTNESPYGFPETTTYPGAVVESFFVISLFTALATRVA